MSGTNTSHVVKVKIDSNGFADVTLDGQPVPNLTRVVIEARPGRSEVQLTIEAVEVVMEGEFPQHKVTERTETYESRRW